MAAKVHRQCAPRYDHPDLYLEIVIFEAEDQTVVGTADPIILMSALSPALLTCT